MFPGCCKHYHGLKFTCDKGVDLRELAGEPELGRITRLPCHGVNHPKWGPLASCELKELPTTEELARAEERWKTRSRYVIQARARIVAWVDGKRGVTGHVACLACGGGTLRYAVMLNGHVHAKCTTSDCLDWME